MQLITHYESVFQKDRSYIMPNAESAVCIFGKQEDDACSRCGAVWSEVRNIWLVMSGLRLNGIGEDRVDLQVGGDIPEEWLIRSYIHRFLAKNLAPPCSLLQSFAFYIKKENT